MDENDYIAGDRGAHVQCGRAANSDSGLVRINEISKRIVRVVLFTMLPWSVYAEAERLVAPVQLDGLINSAAPVDNPSVTTSFKAPAQEVSPGHQLAMNIPGVNTAGEISAGEIVGQEPASIDPVDSTSLEVVDTGTSTHVEKLQPADVVSTGAESPSTLEVEVSVSISGEADELNTAAAGMDDHQASNYNVMLPATDVAEKNEMTSAAGAENGNISGQTEGVSLEATSGEIIQLPYAVLLAILALMSMIPISRRKG